MLQFRQDIVRSLLNLLLPYDLFERYAVACRLLKEELGGDPQRARILDVGGRAGLLERFASYQVISVNVDGTGHLAGSGFALPFADGAFDAVINIDTLEHIPGESRLPFLQECWRVARRAVVVAAPYGSEGHTAYEKRLDSLYRFRFGEAHVYLAEHVHYGLPDADELDRLADNFQIARSRRLYAGDYVRQGKRFERSVMRQRQRGMLARLANFRHYVTSWAMFHPVRVCDRPYATTNRFYWLIVKPGNGTALG